MWRLALKASLLLAAVAALGPQLARADDAGTAGLGRTISRIELRTDVASPDASRAREFIPLREGEALTSDAIRQTLLNLQGTGLVTEVEVLTRTAADTVDVVIAAWSNVIIESIGFVGQIELREEELRDLVTLRERRPLIESRVLRSVYDIMDRHEENGYLEATARADVEVDERLKTATIVFHVDSGPRARVGEITFEGDLGSVDEVDLLAAMESEPGGRYWPQRVRRDADALQVRMIRRSYRTARVARPVTTYDYDTHSMSLSYLVEAGPVVEVSAIGADLEKLRREGLLAFMGVQGYDPALVRFSEQKVRSWFQSQGYYRVVVGAEEQVSEDLIELTLTVERGRQFRLAEVHLEGNESFDDETLRRLMATSERRMFTPASGRLVDSRLEEDLRNLRSYYALQGFGEAVVGPARVEERGSRLVLTVPIEEGPKRAVGVLSWRGVVGLSEAELERGLPLRHSGPYHPTLLNQALNEIRARYRDAGFENALVSSSLEWDVAGRVVDVDFVVLEGRRTVVRRVVVRGQQVTSPWVLRRTIDLQPGDPVSRSQLLEIQRNLYNLGVFTSVSVSLARGELLSGERDVIVQLEEGERHRLSLGGGFNTEDGLRGLLGYSVGNLGGRAASLHLDAIVSQREELYRLLVLQPAVGARRFPLQYSVFRTREEEPSISDALEGDFLVEQVGAQVEAKMQFERLSVPLLYTYKLVENNATGVIDEVFVREKSRVRISSVTAGVEADLRDDPIVPTRGTKSIFQAEYAFPLLGADEDFLKLFVQQTVHFDLGSAGIVGASLRLGGIESFRQDLEAAPRSETACQPDQIPDFGVAISERFFAGGRTTHRAYKLDTLGIPGETLLFSRTPDAETGECREKAFPTGGNGLVLANLDYRYPIFPGFWAIAFYDSGNVWADWRDISLDEFKDGAGVGVGWDSPIGPLRLEIGWKLDREEFEDPYQVFLSFGAVF